MSAINVFTFTGIFDIPQAFCDCVCGAAETHVPVMRSPIVSARWIVELNSDGSRRLVERWTVNRHEADE